MEKPKQEICSIRIMFPVESDEQAIGYKKKIAALLAEIPDVQLNFSISTMPAMPSRP
ncbi:unnamed protein product [marine sediment metagenome]|uniref:Thiamine-binding protein domain-containing protein n=1 Tax=marine sediment metagenome TaxID=412755 RepID=X1H0H1_9ZZZZ